MTAFNIFQIAWCVVLIVCIVALCRMRHGEPLDG